MQERADKREEIVNEFDPVVNARNYHRAQMLKKIINGMDIHVSNLFDEIENIYTSGGQIPTGDIEEMIRDIRRDFDAMELYFD